MRCDDKEVNLPYIIQEAYGKKKAYIVKYVWCVMSYFGLTI